MSAGVFAEPYAVMLRLTDQPALVVGGGAVAWRKAHGLLAAGARVTVVSPTAVEEIRDHPDIEWHARRYRSEDVVGIRLVITATDDAEVNAAVASDAAEANIFVNSADDPQNCDFILPSVVRRGDLQIAVSTNGRSPAFARWLRKRLDGWLSPEHVEAMQLLSEVRDELRRVHGTSEVPGWDRALDDELFALLAHADHSSAREYVRRCVGLESTPSFTTTGAS